MHRSGWTRRLSLVLVVAAPAPLRAQGDYVPDARASPDTTLEPVRWGFSVTPYIWSAGQKGRLAVDGGEANVDLSVGDILNNIKAVVETGDVPFKTRMMLGMMSAFMFMLPKDTLRENIAELKEKR